jgi:hypothetical protein
MALTVSLSYSERNDNKLLTITDTTTNWGVGGNLEIYDIQTLTLDVTVTTSDGTETVYDQIDLVTKNNLGGSSTQANLVFTISCADLEDSGTALGTSSDLLPDGIYEFAYIIDDGEVTETSYTEKILVEGVIRTYVYDLLRTLPTTYNCAECKTKEIMDIIFCKGLLDAMRAASYVAKTEELINQLYTLERLVLYGSTYTW